MSGDIIDNIGIIFAALRPSEINPEGTPMFVRDLLDRLPEEIKSWWLPSKLYGIKLLEFQILGRPDHLQNEIPYYWDMDNNNNIRIYFIPKTTSTSSSNNIINQSSTNLDDVSSAEPMKFDLITERHANFYQRKMKHFRKQRRKQQQQQHQHQQQNSIQYREDESSSSKYSSDEVSQYSPQEEQVGDYTY